MPFYSTEQLPAVEMLAGITRRTVALDQAMITIVTLEPGSVLPEHSHSNEQITYVVRGALEFKVGDESQVLRAGDGAACPANVRHSATVLDELTLVIDAWNPPREDYR
jgi:quercetin dioxygenase-like cupin family protein